LIADLLIESSKLICHRVGTWLVLFILGDKESAALEILAFPWLIWISVRAQFETVLLRLVALIPTYVYIVLFRFLPYRPVVLSLEVVVVGPDPAHN